MKMLSRYLVWDVPPAESFAVRATWQDKPRAEAA
jgi:hypothetical protein